MIEYSTNEMVELINEIDNILLSLSSTLNEFYELINAMPHVTNEWVGKNAEEYVRILNIEKKDYSLLLENLLSNNNNFLFYIDDMVKYLNNAQQGVE